MTNAYTTEAMRKRFWEATAEKEALVEKVAPIRARYDALRAKMGPMETALTQVKKELIAAERPMLAELDGERAVLARALGNKVGERPDG